MARLRDFLAKSNATVDVGETVKQPLVVSDLGKSQQETFIGANTGGLWAEVGDKKCHTCESQVNALTQFAYMTVLINEDGKHIYDFVKHYDTAIAKVTDKPVLNLAVDTPGVKDKADIMTKHLELVCVACAGLMKTHPQHFFEGKCKSPKDFDLPQNPFTAAQNRVWLPRLGGSLRVPAAARLPRATRNGCKRA